MQFILAVLLIDVFVVLLCGLIVVSSRFLRQTGRARVEIKGREAYDSDCGQTLFSAIAENGVFLPAACGGKGTCGRCQVKVLSGGGAVTPMERILLPPDQLAELARLACQVKVRGDIRLEVAPELLTARSFRARLLSAVPVADEIKTLRFALEDGMRLEFTPGQYLQVFYQLPWEKAIRAYSLSSPPQQFDSFSLDVQRIDGGLVSNYLHQLEIGQLVEFSGPFGEMAFGGEHLHQSIILVAGGVGLAPMRSIVEHLCAQGFPQSVMLFHGARSRANLYAEEYFRGLERNHANFRYVPALSNPMLEDGWVGERGMIHTTLEQRLESAAGHVAFVCGPAPMMQAVTKVLVAKGVASDRIFTDPFDF